jgi:MFS family permease
MLVFNSLLPQPRVWVLYLCAALFAAMNGLQRPSLDALMPRLVPAELVPAASALRSLGATVGMIGGPALGGLLVATVGPALTYSFDFVTFAASLAALWAMSAVPPPVGADRPSLRTIVEGLALRALRPELLGTYLIDINAMFFGMPMALFPAIAERFGGSSVGLLYAAPAVGAMCVTLTSGWTKRVNRHGLCVVLAAGVWGAGNSRLRVRADCYGRRYSCLALAGAADMISGLFRMTIWGQTIPDHLRGSLAGHRSGELHYRAAARKRGVWTGRAAVRRARVGRLGRASMRRGHGCCSRSYCPSLYAMTAAKVSSVSAPKKKRGMKG